MPGHRRNLKEPLMFISQSDWRGIGCQSLLHPSTESTHLTCSSNLVITAWTHSTGLWAAMAGRRDTATLCWQIQGVRLELTSLSMHENVSRNDGKGPRGRVFFPFYRIHHATAMTHHRKSSSEKSMGGVGEHVAKMVYGMKKPHYELRKWWWWGGGSPGHRGRRGRHIADGTAVYARHRAKKISIAYCDSI